MSPPMTSRGRSWGKSWPSNVDLEIRLRLDPVRMEDGECGEPRVSRASLVSPGRFFFLGLGGSGRQWQYV